MGLKNKNLVVQRFEHKIKLKLRESKISSFMIFVIMILMCFFLKKKKKAKRKKHTIKYTEKRMEE